MAVEGDHVVLFGGYDDARNRLALLQLDGDDSAVVTTFSVAGDGHDMPGARLTVGRGDTLHLISKGQWQRLTVGDIRRAAGI